MPLRTTLHNLPDVVTHQLHATGGKSEIRAFGTLHKPCRHHRENAGDSELLTHEIHNEGNAELRDHHDERGVVVKLHQQMKKPAYDESKHHSQQKAAEEGQQEIAHRMLHRKLSREEGRQRQLERHNAGGIVEQRFVLQNDQRNREILVFGNRAPTAEASVGVTMAHTVMAKAKGSTGNSRCTSAPTTMTVTATSTIASDTMLRAPLPIQYREP